MDDSDVRHVYISPHADDVALSCGGRIIANPACRADTVVVTVFTSETSPNPPDKPFADALNRHRTAEDRSAWDSLSVRAEYLDLPEALLRGKFPFALFGCGQDDQVTELVYARLCAVIAAFPHATYYFPAGFGNHLDHLLCRDAAFRLLDAGILANIRLYEDIPYSWLRFIRRRYYKLLLRGAVLDKASKAIPSRPGGIGWPAYLRGRAVPFPRGKKLFAAVGMSLFIIERWRRLRRRKRRYAATIAVFELGAGQIAAKARLVSHYATQLPMLFGAEPEQLLRDRAGLFAVEATTELVRLP